MKRKVSSSSKPLPDETIKSQKQSIAENQTMSTAEEFKEKGNAALQAGNTSEAIEYYTKAINADGANHVYFSNRSAAYLKKGDANNALEDANSCIGLCPDFSKGYSRKGSALHALKRYNDSIAAYEVGLARFPNDAALKKGLEDVKREKDNPYGIPSGGGGGGGAPSGGGGLFSPSMLAQMQLDPRMRPLLADPEVMAKIQMIQKNPNLLSTMLQDPKMMQLIGILAGGATEQDEGPFSETPVPSTPASTPAKNAKAPETIPEPVQEDWSQLNPEERKIKEDQREAIKRKEEGNEFYKTKKFQEALDKYDEAIALDPTNMTFLSNKAAVYFTSKKYDDCIEMCLKAVQVGKEHRAPFEERSKAYTRAAKAYQKKNDYGKAIEMCKESQLESFDNETQRMLKTLELEKKKADALAYQSEELAEEAKLRGNEFFRNKDWAQAVAAYEEAVKRAPKNASIRNNLAAALCKIMDFSGAQRQIEIALEIDPKYVKAWARKGDIEMYMKEYHKAMESYKVGLELDPDNSACQEGFKKVMVQINYGRKTMSESEKKEQAAHAMADPEIQAILQDPVLQQVLRDFGENPLAAQQAMNDTNMRRKIEKLIAAGVIETR